MENQIIELPVLVLNGVTIFPETIMHFDVTKEESIKALEDAMEAHQEIFLVSQKEKNNELIDNAEKLYSFGIITKINQMIKLSRNVVRVLAIGKTRANLEKLTQLEPYLKASVHIIEEEEKEIAITEINALKDLANDLIDEFHELHPKFSSEVIERIKNIDEIGELADGIGFHLIVSLENKQTLLGIIDSVERLEFAISVLKTELEIEKIKLDIQSKVKQKIDKNQKNYYLKEQMKVIQNELGESFSNQEEIDEYKNKLASLKADKIVKQKIEKEIKRLEKTPFNSSESVVIRNYIEWLFDIPWEKKTKENKNIKDAQDVLNEDHYGLKKVKERILEYLAVRTLTNNNDSPIICLVGPPGTGKTSIAKSIARSVNRKYQRISLGGVRDESEIRGHRRTYIGSMPGRIVSALKNAEVNNPVILLDEIDKMSNDFRGDPASALLEVLDGEQNNKFVDHYLEVPVDLSDVLFIATANSIKNIPRPLLDRLEIIEINSYTENEKINIAQRFLLPKQKKKHGIEKISLTVSKEAISKIINEYTKESGVRSLERNIASICRKVAKKVLTENKKSIKVNSNNIEKYLGKPKYIISEVDKKPQIGVVTGLAWTEFGGDTLSIEVNLMEGKGNLELTGRLGNVMKESAKAAISYIRGAEIEGVSKNFYKTKDIHIHVPEGAVPKDGPSAGITMATALISALTSKPVKPGIAMTGEVTIRGRVLPIGGLKEKLLAAKRVGINKVIIPEENKKNIMEIDAEILKGLEIIYVSQMGQVIKEALQ